MPSLSRFRERDLDEELDWTGSLEDEEETFEPPRRPARGSKGARPARGGGKQPAPRKQRRGTELEVEDDWDDEIVDVLERKERERRRAGISEPFKCRNCRSFIGMPPTGGQQRNHCPMCLYSLHVDDKTPGDRASECRSLMQPDGVFYRRNMEQVLVHRCLGCGFTRYNRIAADDNLLLLNELPIVDPPARSDDDES